MNRKQRRNMLKSKSNNRPKHNVASVTASNAQGILDNLEISQLAAGVNNLLEQMRNRGVDIFDWDNKRRKLYKLQMVRGKFYFLAAEIENNTEE